MNFQRYLPSLLATVALTFAASAATTNPPAKPVFPTPPAPPAPAASNPAGTNKLTPSPASEQQRKRFEEWRKQHPEEAARMDQVRNMTPEQREAARQEWMRKQATNTPPNTAQRTNNLQSRQERLNTLRTRLEQREAELQKKKGDGTITDQETKDLEQTRTWLRQMTNSPMIRPPSATPPPTPAPVPTKPSP